mgnify:CR=1 FL=1
MGDDGTFQRNDGGLFCQGLANIGCNLTIQHFISFPQQNSALHLWRSLGPPQAVRRLAQPKSSSQPNVADGDFAFNTTVNLNTSRVTRQTHQQQFLEVTLTSYIFAGSRYEMLGDVTHSVRIPIGGTSISRTISALTTPKRSEIHLALFQLVGTHATVLPEKMLCSPLSATMAARKNGRQVTTGARPGI